MKIEEEIIKYYERYDESKRLASDIGPLELVRTQESSKGSYLLCQRSYSM